MYINFVNHTTNKGNIMKNIVKYTNSEFNTWLDENRVIPLASISTLVIEELTVTAVLYEGKIDNKTTVYNVTQFSRLGEKDNCYIISVCIGYRATHELKSDVYYTRHTWNTENRDGTISETIIHIKK